MFENRQIHRGILTRNKMASIHFAQILLFAYGFASADRLLDAGDAVSMEDAYNSYRRNVPREANSMNEMVQAREEQYESGSTCSDCGKREMSMDLSRRISQDALKACEELTFLCTSPEVCAACPVTCGEFESAENEPTSGDPSYCQPLADYCFSDDISDKCPITCGGNENPEPQDGSPTCPLLQSKCDDPNVKALCLLTCAEYHVP